MGRSVVSQIDRLFVYGTLMRGECRHGALGGRRNVAEIEPAEVTGRLVDCGSYPGLLPVATGRVVGELVRVLDVEGTLAKLDRIEGYLGEGVPGSLYHRVVVDARAESGRTLTAWTYVLVEPDGLPEIPSGSWKERAG